MNLTRELATQWGPTGVEVNAVAPGFFPTEMTGNLTDPDQRRQITERTLLRLPARVHELDGAEDFYAISNLYLETNSPSVSHGGGSLSSRST